MPVTVPLARLGGDVAAALRVARDRPAALTAAQALALITADGADLDAVCALADDVRRDTVGDDVTFVPGHGPISTFGEERRTNPFVSDAALRQAPIQREPVGPA